MSKTVEFIFDFASPNAYLAHKALPPVLARTGASVTYTPCLLGGIFRATNNRAPMVQFADVPARMAYERLEMQRFIAAHGLTRFTMNPHFPVNTLTLMRAAIVASEAGTLGRFINIGLEAMWEAGENMADPAVIVRVLDAHGFDGTAMIARTQEQTIKDRLVANTEAAVARGVFGIPSFFVGDDLYFGKDRLAQVEAALA
ncbi:MAG: 2-hydroxychromene-2-carboxylate isomerase [Sphingomonas sp.]|uniref:2-hydroxychromene-2-carboxylate isomerase n=1 Tax=Sphingomonas sp. TaxID=28214 RepID=UPI0035A8DD99|nr:2-hydroxychromene-2-carboxylate isomerase [Sphingomonas sp.]